MYLYDRNFVPLQIFQPMTAQLGKRTFLSEGTDVFVISPNRGIFYFPELENLNFGDFQDQMRPSCL